MSKLYKRYVLLKIQNPNKIYLFECGIFYVFIHDDAYIMAKVLNLRLTDLNSMIKKCGFPVKSANKYFNILKSLDYDITIVPSDDNCAPSSISSYITNQKYDTIIKDFLQLNMDNLSISQAFDVLHEFQDRFKSVGIDNLNNQSNEEEL